MIGVIGSEEPEREWRFIKNFGEALFEYLLEAGELIPYALVFLLLGFGAYIVGTMVYRLMFDPNAVDVASRLEALSVDPEKWIHRA